MILLKSEGVFWYTRTTTCCTYRERPHINFDDDEINMKINLIKDHTCIYIYLTNNKKIVYRVNNT